MSSLESGCFGDCPGRSLLYSGLSLASCWSWGFLPHPVSVPHPQAASCGHKLRQGRFNPFVPLYLVSLPRLVTESSIMERPLWFSSRVHGFSALIHVGLICIELCWEKLTHPACLTPRFRACVLSVLLSSLPGPSAPTPGFHLCLYAVGAEKEVLGGPARLHTSPATVSSCFL